MEIAGQDTRTAAPGAAESRFHLAVRGMPGIRISVEQFATGHHRPGGLFDWWVDACFPRGTSLEELSQAQIELTVLNSAGRQVRMAGRVRRVTLQSGDGQAGMTVRIDCESPLAMLQRVSHQRVFVAQTHREIIERILSAHDIGSDELDWQVDGQGPRSPLVVQYRESDLDLLMRLLARAGWLIDFSEAVGDCRLRIAPDLGSLAPDQRETLSWVPESGQVRKGESITQLRLETRATRGGLVVTGDDPERVGERLEVGRRTGSDPVSQHDGTGLDRPALEQEAIWRDSEQQSQARQLHLVTDCNRLRPGTELTLTGVDALLPEAEAGVSTWRVVAVRHEGDQRQASAAGEGDVGASYQSEVVLVPADVDWRPPWPERRVERGSFTARVEGDSTEVACLDEEGRYRIRFAFDATTPEGDNASAPLRRIQPYGGADHGMHLPLLPGTSIIVACLDGDPDRPVILGATPDAQHPSPVTAENPTEHVVRTAAGNQWLMDDARNRERIRLETPGGEAVTLNAADGNQSVAIESPNGDLLLDAGTNLLVEAGGDYQLAVGGDCRVEVDGNEELVTREGDIRQTAAGELRIRSDQKLKFESDQAGVEMLAETELALESEQTLNMNATDGPIEMRSSDTMDLSSDGSLHMLGGDEILIEHGSSSLRISDDRVEINARELVIEADTINASGGSGIDDN